MSARIRGVVELVVAAVAAVGCILFWLAAATVVEVSPILAGEPSKSSTIYEPTFIALSLLLATATGVLAVLGVARLRRR